MPSLAEAKRFFDSTGNGREDALVNPSKHVSAYRVFDVGLKPAGEATTTLPF